MSVIQPPGKLAGQRNPPSDRELLGREFVTRDPESLPDLSPTMPSDYLTAEIEFWHDVTPPKGQDRSRDTYVWCAHDGKKTHWKGYVMKSASGVRFLIGKDCGKEVFGYDFNLVTRHFAALRTRQSQLNRHGSTVAALPGAIAELGRLIDHGTLNQYRMIKSRLRSATPDLYQNLAEAVRQHRGALIVEERVRDYDAELRRADYYGHEDDELERLQEQRKRREITVTEFKRLRAEVRARKKDREDDPIYRNVSKPVGSVSGGDLFIAGPEPKAVLQQELAKLRDILQKLSGSTEKITARSFTSLFQKARKSIETIEAELQRLRAPVAFFGETNLAGIARWASQAPECGGKYRAAGKAIIWEAPDDDVEVFLPREYEVPATPALEALKSAVSKTGLDKNPGT